MFMHTLKKLFVPKPYYERPEILTLSMFVAFYGLGAGLWCIVVGLNIAPQRFAVGGMLFALGIVLLYVLALPFWVWYRTGQIIKSRTKIDVPPKAVRSSNIDKMLIDTSESLSRVSTQSRRTCIASNEQWMLWDKIIEPQIKTGIELMRAGEICYTAIEYKLRRSLPRVIFDSKKARGSQYRRVIDEVQRLSYEGNFDDTFESYCAAGYAIEALSFITPEVLEALLAIPQYDFEIVEDSLFCIGPLIANDELVDFKLSCDELFQKLNDHVGNYRDSFVPIDQAAANNPLGSHIVKRPMFTQGVFFGLLVLTLSLLAWVFTSHLSLNAPDAYYAWVALPILVGYGLLLWRARRAVSVKGRQAVDKLDEARYYSDKSSAIRKKL